jgi:hypothetical protein
LWLRKCRGLHLFLGFRFKYESLIAAGGINNKYGLFFIKMVRFIYNRADKILISSRALGINFKNGR